MKELKKYTKLKKLGRACFLVKHIGNKNQQYVLKCQPKAVYVKQKVSRFIFGGSLPFQNEFRILSLLKEYKKVPSLPIVEENKNVYYLIPYINNTISFTNLDNSTYKKIGESVAEISKFPVPQKWNFLKEYIFEKIGSPTLRFQENLKIGKQKYQIPTLKFEILENQISKISQSIKKRIIHNDLGDNNIIVASNNSFYFIDWEDARLENKAIFLDLVTVAFDYNDFSLNRYIVKGFVENYEVDQFENKYFNELLGYSYIVYLYKLIKMKRFDTLFKMRVVDKLKFFSEDIDRLLLFTKQYVQNNQINISR